MALWRTFSVLLLLVISSSTYAATINFDDIDASFGDMSLDAISPYQGLTWTNFLAYTATPGFPGFNNGIVSSDNAAYSGGEFFGATTTPVVGKIQSSQTFDFTRAALGSAYYDGLSLTVQGLLGGSLLYTRTLTLDTTGAQFFDFAFNGIDELDFFGGTTAATTDPFACGPANCTLFTLDDLTLLPRTIPPPPPPPGVPEPASWALLLLGLLMAGWMRRRI